MIRTAKPDLNPVSVIRLAFLDRDLQSGIRREDKSRERNGCENPIKIKSRRRRRVMAGQMLCTNSSLPIHHNNKSPLLSLHEIAENVVRYPSRRAGGKLSVQCSENQTQILRTCKHCKSQFDPLQNHPRACRFHSAHFGGETKRKFESVYTGGTMHTPDSGKVYQYWHCCGSEDPFDPGCTAAPHSSYDD